MFIARGAGQIIRHFHSSMSPFFKLKSDGSDVTEADFVAQLYITRQLAKHFPKLKWVGKRLVYSRGRGFLRNEPSQNSRS